MKETFEKLKVLELANILAGPSVGMFFAELGAEVIKVENRHTGGDSTRAWKLQVEDKETDISSYFSCVNWGKKSIGVDLKCEDGREVVYDLVRRSDIVIQSYKPGDEKKLLLDYETLRGIKPDLIYGHVTAYGTDDPRPGYDAIIQAESGFTYLNGHPDGEPTKMPVALVDLLLAHQLKEGLLLALLKRFQTGEGSRVTTSLLKSAVASLANQAANWLVAGVIPQRMGSEHPNIVPYGTLFPTAEGKVVVVAAATQGQYHSLLDLLNLGHLRDDERFVTNQLRVQHRGELVPMLAARMERLTAPEAAAELESRKIPFGFVNNMEEVFAEKGMDELILEGNLPDGKPIRGARSVAFEGSLFESATALAPPPHFNQHGDEVLGELLGYGEEKVSRLRAAGAVA